MKRVEVDPSSSAKHAFVASMGASSAVGMSFAVGVRWRWGNTSIASEIAGTPPYDVVQDHVSVERASVAIAPCHHIGDFGVCGVLRVGLDRGVGTGLMGSSFRGVASRRAWAAPGLGIRCDRLPEPYS